jgi:catechol 2,3-dioxygenase-like lactoylglutathione lyase family enzyme
LVSTADAERACGGAKRERKRLSAAVLVAIGIVGLVLPMLESMPGARAELVSVSRPSSTSLASEDIDKLGRWYEEALRFARVSERTTVRARVIVLTRKSFLLELREQDRGNEMSVSAPPTQDVETTSALPTAPKPSRIALSLIVDDLEEELAHLRSIGVVVAAEPEDDLSGRYRVAFIRDPEGRLVELREFA